MPRDESTVFGQRIRSLRKAQGLTQAELAEKLGYEPMTISRFERGTYGPNFDALIDLAKVFSVSIASLMSFEVVAPLDVSELRHQLCDLIYETADPEALQAMLKAVRKIAG